MELQHRFIDAFARLAAADERIHAAWLEGSFGGGIADRYSDIDAHLLVDAACLDAFRQGVRSWLESIADRNGRHPLVLFNLIFDGQMVNALTVDGLRVDLWLHAGDTFEASTPNLLVLWDRGGRLTPGKLPIPPSPAEVAAKLTYLVPEFWRCIAMLPVGAGRGELVAGFQGLIVEIGLLVDMLIVGNGRQKDRGAKAINHLLPADVRTEIEGALRLPILDRTQLAAVHLRLAALMQHHGPILCARWGVEYPQGLEDAVMRYVMKELRANGHLVLNGESAGADQF
ncbi:MAG: hypothetical protein KF893_17535 [Caldilineaceae bacterium]|nr:hypothetical protein [Caldilineaceae bacterium]